MPYSPLERSELPTGSSLDEAALNLLPHRIHRRLGAEQIDFVKDTQMMFQQPRNTLAAREDMEARRAALYQQAGARAEAASQTARAAQAARLAQDQQNATGTTTPATTGQSPSQNAGHTAATQSVPLQPSAAPPTNNSGSPK